MWLKIFTNNQLNYKDALIKLDVLPLFYFQVLTELLLLSKMINGQYDIQCKSFCTFDPNSRSHLFSLPKIQREFLRGNFWYKTCFRANLLWKRVDFRNSGRLKGRILKLMWKSVSKSYNPSNTCS